MSCHLDSPFESFSTPSLIFPCKIIVELKSNLLHCGWALRYLVKWMSTVHWPWQRQLSELSSDQYLHEIGSLIHHWKEENKIFPKSYSLPGETNYNMLKWPLMCQILCIFCKMIRSLENPWTSDWIMTAHNSKSIGNLKIIFFPDSSQQDLSNELLRVLVWEHKCSVNFDVHLAFLKISATLFLPIIKYAVSPLEVGPKFALNWEVGWIRDLWKYLLIDFKTLN